jgi:hypothetical protein
VPVLGSVSDELDFPLAAVRGKSHRSARNTPRSKGVRDQSRSVRMNRILRPTALLLSLVGVGCASQMIPNTDVEDNGYNRSVIQFCEQYRHAVEDRNVALLLKIAAPSYYEDGGNVDPTDDLDYPGLKTYLEDKFYKTKAIRYEIRYRRVGKGRRDIVYVDYTYSASYKLSTDEGDVWRRTVADNRIELVPDGEKFKVVSGM